MLTRTGVVVLMAGALAACMQPARHFPDATELESLIEARVARRQAVGLALGVMEADGSVTTVVAGSAGEGARTLGDSTVFEIGSITKTVTALLLAEMVRTGEVRYSDPVSRYLPAGVWVPSRNGRDITLLELATHHSGLPAMPDNATPRDWYKPLADYSVGQLHEFLSGFHPPAVAPKYQYSNVGYGLLGQALSHAANTPFEELARQRVLKPLGMSETVIDPRGGLGERMAKGHNKRGAIVPSWELPTLAGAGALRSTLADQMRYLAASLGEPKTALERSMRATHREQRVVSDTTSIGMGWQIREVGDSRIVWKDGGTGGFQSFIGFDPERGVGVVLLSNSTLEVDDIAFHLLTRKLPLIDPVPFPPVVKVPAAVLASYAGEYSLETGDTLTVSVEGGTLFTRRADVPRLRAYALSETRFGIDILESRITFVRSATGAVTGLILQEDDRDIPARKVR